jgi:hypothetical protein
MTALLAPVVPVLPTDNQTLCLPPGVASVADLTGHLSIARVKSTRESRLVRHLMAHDIGFYLPRHKQVKWSERKNGKSSRVTSWVVLLQGFVFVAGGDDGRVEAAEWGRRHPDDFYGFIGLAGPWLDKELRGELRTLEVMLDVDPTLNVRDGLARGMKVRVARGPLMGMEGFYDGDAKQGRISIRLTSLNASASAEVPRDFVELAD